MAPLPSFARDRFRIPGKMPLVFPRGQVRNEIMTIGANEIQGNLGWGLLEKVLGTST